MDTFHSPALTLLREDVDGIEVEMRSCREPRVAAQRDCLAGPDSLQDEQMDHSASQEGEHVGGRGGAGRSGGRGGVLSR